MLPLLRNNNTSEHALSSRNEKVITRHSPSQKSIIGENAVQFVQQPTVIFAFACSSFKSSVDCWRPHPPSLTVPHTHSLNFHLQYQIERRDQRSHVKGEQYAAAEDAQRQSRNGQLDKHGEKIHWRGVQRPRIGAWV